MTRLEPRRTTIRAFWPVRLLFTSALFLSAVLLFSVEPMVAKLILPSFGGAAAVRTTCMMFYQVALLVGYGYADVATRRWPVRPQAIAHCGLIAVPLVFLPLGIPADWAPPAGSNPVLSLSWLLLGMVGLPLVALATIAPTLQAWFAHTDDPRASDPYFLYAASNAGSLLGLLAYPLILEPKFGLRSQTIWWTGGYVAFLLLVVGCAVSVFRANRRLLLGKGDRHVSNTDLLTTEAIQLYLQKSSAHAVLAFHVSNLYVDLVPVLANAAHALGLAAFVNNDRNMGTLSPEFPEDKWLGKTASTWVALVRSAADLAGLAGDRRWQAVRADSRIPVWTDDAASLWPVLHLSPDWLSSARDR